jgi:large subunit ribosomal protein L31
LCILGFMKSDIHPTYFPKAKVVCACGTIYEVGSTKESMEVEICGACHPFYTGKEKLIDTAGRVEKFKAKIAKAAATPKKAPKAPRVKKTEKATKAK